MIHRKIVKVARHLRREPERRGSLIMVQLEDGFTVTLECGHVDDCPAPLPETTGAELGVEWPCIECTTEADMRAWLGAFDDATKTGP